MKKTAPYWFMAAVFLWEGIYGIGMWLNHRIGFWDDTGSLAGHHPDNHLVEPSTDF
jgi:hypothetical protein